MLDDLGHIRAVSRVVGGIVPPSDEEESQSRKDDTNTLEPYPLAEAFLEQCQHDPHEDEDNPNEEDSEDGRHLNEILPILVVYQVGDLWMSRIISKALLGQEEEEVSEEEYEEGRSIPCERST